MSMRFAFAAALLCSSICPSMLLADGPNDEPQLEVRIEIDGKPVDATFDKPVAVTIDGKRHVVKLTPKPTRLFSKASVAFEYPSYFTYEFDNETPGVVIYTLEGHNTTLMVQSFDEEAITSTDALGAVAAELRDAFGDSLTNDSEIVARLGGKRVKGRRLAANFAGQRLQQDLFPLEGMSGVLMWQVVPDDEGKETAEMKTVQKLLDETFRTQPVAGGKRPPSRKKP